MAIKLDKNQMGIMFEIKDRAKRGNVRLDSKQLLRARELIAKKVTSSWYIYRLILKIKSVYAQRKYINK